MSSAASSSQVRKLLAPASAVAALWVSAVVAAPVIAAPQAIGGGHLDWGVKQSFRTYITGPIAHGSYAASEGATKLGEPAGAIRFPVLSGSYDGAAATGELTVGGAVQFTGHGGDLSIRIAKLRVVLTGATGVLHADVTSRNRDTGTVQQYPGVGLVTLSVPAPATTATGASWSSIPSVMTAEGAPAFANFYPAGTEMDPLAPLTVEFGQSAAPPSQETPSPTTAPVVERLAKKTVRVSRRGVAALATLSCGSSPCTVSAPKAVKVKIKSKRGKRRAYRIKVLAPKRLAPNASAKLRVKLGKAARRALAGRRATVRVKVRLTAGAVSTTRTVKTALKGKRRVPKARARRG